MPEGKANKAMMDIWVGKHSMRRNGERTIVLYFITLSSITKSEPDRKYKHLPSILSISTNVPGKMALYLASSIKIL
jgi:hypothetical protein